MFQRELFFKARVDRIPRKSQLPRGQPSSHQRPRKTHAPVYARKMYVQRGCDPTHKLVVGAVMPFDSRLQTAAKVQDNRIVGRYAGPYGKLDDSSGAVIVSQLIESCSRNEKAEAVGNVFGMGSPIESQIDEANYAIWKGNYLETAFFWLACSEGIPLQSKHDPLLR